MAAALATSLSRASSLQRAGSLTLPGPALPAAKVLGPARGGAGLAAAAALRSPLTRAGSAPAGGCCAALPSENSATSSSRAVDPFVAAGARLQGLLARVGDGEEELLNSMVAEEAPEKKLQTSVVLGGALTIGAIVVATLCGKDPWGGASLSLDTVVAAAVGAMASVPLVLFRSWSWTPQAYKALPALQDVHDAQLELHRPWLTRMDSSQVMLMMALEVLPLTLLLFPAAQGGIVASLKMYSQMLHNPGLASQEEYLAAVALMVTCVISGVGRSLELSVSEEEYDLVQTASANADRYYRTVTTDVYRTPAEAGRAADAFRYVAQAWLQTKGEASLLTGVMTAVDILLLGVLWRTTGDLAAPAVAALAINWVDFRALHAAVLRKDAKGARSG